MNLSNLKMEDVTKFAGLGVFSQAVGINALQRVHSRMHRLSRCISALAANAEPKNTESKIETNPKIEVENGL